MALSAPALVDDGFIALVPLGRFPALLGRLAGSFLWLPTTAAGDAGR